MPDLLEIIRLLVKLMGLVLFSWYEKNQAHPGNRMELHGAFGFYTVLQVGKFID